MRAMHAMLEEVWNRRVTRLRALVQSLREKYELTRGLERREGGVRVREGGLAEVYPNKAQRIDAPHHHGILEYLSESGEVR